MLSSVLLASVLQPCWGNGSHGGSDQVYVEREWAEGVAQPFNRGKSCLRLHFSTPVCLCDQVLTCVQPSSEPALQVCYKHSACRPGGCSAASVRSALLYWHRVPPAYLIKCFPSQASCLLYREWEAAWVHSVVLWHGCDMKLRILASFQLESLHFAFLNCLSLPLPVAAIHKKKPKTTTKKTQTKTKPPKPQQNQKNLQVREQLLGSCWEATALQWKTHSGEWIFLQPCSFSLVHSPFPVFQMLPLSMLPRPSLIVYEQR